VRARAYDVIVVGGGIVGVTVALELRKQGEKVIVLDRGKPGREASHASAGMLAWTDIVEPPEFRAFAEAGARLFPGFVDDLRADSETKIDFQRSGAISFSSRPGLSGALSEGELQQLEPRLEYRGEPAYFIAEDFVDPRTLIAAAIASAKRRGVEFATGSEVTSIVTSSAKIAGVKTSRRSYAAPVVVNCCGAWSAQLGLPLTPTRPVKGHMLALLPRDSGTLRHVLRSRELDTYLLPRDGGMIVVGSTVEEAGFDKAVVPDTIQALHQRAADLIPILGEAKIHESWAGLRPGSPDDLPIIGPAAIEGYFAATGHYRNGILLAPITAKVLTRMINGGEPELNMRRFSPLRF
jgi:glycine oxidase